MRRQRRRSWLTVEGRWRWSRTKHFKKASDNLRFSLSEVWGEWGRSKKAAEGMRGGVSCVWSRVL